MDPIKEQDDDDTLPKNFTDFKRAKAQIAGSGEIAEIKPVKSALKKQPTEPLTLNKELSKVTEEKTNMTTSVDV